MRVSIKRTTLVKTMERIGIFSWGGRKVPQFSALHCKFGGRVSSTPPGDALGIGGAVQAGPKPQGGGLKLRKARPAAESGRERPKKEFLTRLIHGKYLLFSMVFLYIFIPSALCSLTIKLASPLPEGTEWNNGLLEMANEWRKISGGKIKLKVYPGSIAGSESDMIRKIRIGQLDIGIFSVFGIRAMVPETFVVSLPGLIQNDDELDYVLSNWVGRFDTRFREEGFEILSWSQAGWAYLFAKEPLRIPADLQRQTLVIDNTETDMAAAFKALGFRVAPVALGEIMVSLQSGLANSYYAPPVAAAAFQWFALTPYMTNYQLAPVVGGVVMSGETWRRIPGEYRDELKASMVALVKGFYDESLRLNNEALRVMGEHGLKLIEISKEERAQWDKKMLFGHELMVGTKKSIPPAVYDGLKSVLQELRK
ncbi:MAG: hypothetical protein B0D92_07960 [Spirochaeta sp. LUC14_002_19_P3]|nr:MAG: hypothetical protein B0D92_07960 [Spirochaeta sp. LUC14_002_19_P3]